MVGTSKLAVLAENGRSSSFQLLIWRATWILSRVRMVCHVYTSVVNDMFLFLSHR